MVGKFVASRLKTERFCADAEAARRTRAMMMKDRIGIFDNGRRKALAREHVQVLNIHAG